MAWRRPKSLVKSRFGVEFSSTIFINPDICKIKFSKIKSTKNFLWLFKSLYGWSQVQNFQLGFSRRRSTFSQLSSVLALHWPVCAEAQQTRWQRRRRASNSCNGMIKNSIKIKFCLCCSDYKTKRRQPLCSWFPSTPDHEPILRCPTGLSRAKKPNNFCLTVFTLVFIII